jgi:hypothetical protein
VRAKTRKQYYGRSAVAQALRSASTELNNAIQLSEKPPESPLAESLRKVAANIERAIEFEKLYILGRKRIATSLAKEQKAINKLLSEVMALPVLPAEKITAKRKRAENRQRKA